MIRPLLRVAATILSVAVVFAPVLQGQPTGVQYVYDESGRLVAAIDAAGETAIYVYDAVGNLLSIARKSPTDVSIYEWTPNAGPAGTTVTIWGSGFSATPAQNTVQFNGTAAAVSASSPTTLVVAVPTGATTGPISVTTPNGSATSAGAFTVGPDPAPTVTSFSPPIAVSGNTLTINGSGFQAVGANNRVKVGVGPGALVTTSQTQITVTVPAGTGSGLISVATPFGIGTSPTELFVPPSPYGPTDVDFTGKLVFGQGTGVGITTVNHIGLAIFDGTSGQRVSLKAVPGPNSGIAIYKPDGAVLIQAGTGIGTILLEPGLLPAPGTYTVSVDPAGTGTGTVTLTPYLVPPDLSGVITPTATGAAVSPNIGTPGQNARYTFTGTVGQRISVKISPGPLGTVSLRNPSDTALASGSIGVVTSFIEPQTLSANGTHAVFADLSGANTGSLTVTTYDVPPDLSGTIQANGQLTNVTIQTPGQNGLLTFSGTSGQRVFVHVGTSAPYGTVALLNPDGSTLGSANSGIAAAFIDTRTLGSTATHSIGINPTSYNTGTVKVTLYDVPADTTAVTIGGSSLARSFAVGQNGTVTFAGTGGQQVTVRLTSNSMGSVVVRLKRADGTLLTSTTSSSSSFNLAAQTLPATETYTIELDPQQWNAGNITVAVTTP